MHSCLARAGIDGCTVSMIEHGAIHVSDQCRTRVDTERWDGADDVAGGGLGLSGSGEAYAVAHDFFERFDVDA